MTDAERHWALLWSALAAAFATMLIGLFGPHGASLLGVERQVKQSVEQALQREGHPRIAVESYGQEAHLYGAAPSEDERTAIIDAALRAAGPGGAWAGGVTAVDADGLVVGQPVSPYTWRVRRRGDVVTLSGHAPTPRSKTHLLNAARETFGIEPRDEMRIANGAPNRAWLEVAVDAIAQVRKLRQGEARLSDNLLVVLGDGTAAVVDELSAHYRAPLPEPYRARVEAAVTGEGPDFADLGGVNLADASAETCQIAFANMMRRNVINFATASAEVDRSSLRLLDQLASIALRCDSFNIEISGHTDNVGPREANMALSQRRAASVAAYLVGQGVARERLTAVGFGPDRPRQNNATPVGQAANRRIEFAVRE